jgi:glycosyltransferase involved in cell wall biosynthesis
MFPVPMNILIVPVYIRKIADVAMLRRMVVSAGANGAIDKIIIVDDCSPIRYDLNTYGLGMRLVEQIKLEKNRGPAHARNIGIARALDLGASNLFFTDHDCELLMRWAKEMNDFLVAGPYAMAGGITLSRGDTLLDRYHEINGTLNGRSLPNGDLLYTPSCNMAMRACVAMDFRFDESFPSAAGEDVDFCLRARSRYRIGLCRKAIICHDWGYQSTIVGLPKFINTFRKYKAAHSLLRSNHSRMNWESEPIPSTTL